VSLSPVEEEIQARLEQKLYAAAFDLIQKHYSDKIMRLAYSILGNRTLAEETAQDILVRIWRALQGFRGDASISTWVFAIARNTSLSAVRRTTAQRRVLSFDESVVRSAAELVPAPGFAESRTPDIEKLVSSLPDPYRRVIMLYYMEERSYEDVARLLDLPIGTVRTHLHRAKKALAAAVMENTSKGNP
jgi:RNA polymerase sigma-70 factor, ECF subfamily